ncbi:hydroxymethylbilane synthase [Flavobacterium salilacus subsp. salilacus]|uniref:hydroxymethylbilane synthase n=1 Tax=Flavobacterium TaxID=237 RepID=UPI001074DC57|nr:MULTISPECIES: hydroxymethylbilane synthase [Flavobacterium]KAF2518912.1 hydroxymethylbilane synthase [Flavobacterium salilacus subsp. salilacus]MBE1614926.1 hydroxymethylbilane synthase [Flavobacterium sp. SaA2.13]
MNKAIRIGTRDSELALWQAHTVQAKLETLGYATEIVAVKSTGDVVLDVPLYEFGITGIFTKTLDVAMIKGEVDIAVHSMKDVPTALPKGIVQAAVLERADTHDVLVHKGSLNFLHETGTIATGSLRRQAQWLNRYPHHTVTDLRGNVNTRLKKLEESNWGGAIFAAAGLDRLGFLSGNQIESPSFGGVGEALDWMIPAPAQGAMVVVAMENDDYCREALAKLNHTETETCTFIERQFLKKLEGGCTAPIGALARFEENIIRFEGILLSIDGKQKIHIEKTIAADADYSTFGTQCAQEVLDNGGVALMQDIRAKLNKK